MRVLIKGGTLISPLEVSKNKAILLENEKILSLSAETKEADLTIDLKSDDLIFPGLINAHDHLLGNYYPKVGSGPYLNWKPWDNDLKQAPVYQERGKISNEDLYRLASFRNIISGVTTVQDHIPHFVNEKIIEELPVRVLKDYTLSHECSSYDLKWGKSISEEHNLALQKDLPYITHIEEGFDEEAMLGIDILNELKALDSHTVLIHGIAFSKRDIDLIAKKEANVVWCPVSNYFMFKETTPIQYLLKKKVNVALGTDSPMSGSLNILEEMRFARSLYQELYGEELEAKEIVKMVTLNAAKALRLKDLGQIATGFKADFTIIQNGNPNDPYQSLINSDFNSIKLVVRSGKALYGNIEFKNWFESNRSEYQKVRIEQKERLLIQKPNDLYLRIQKAVQYKKEIPFLPIDGSVA